MRHFLEIQILIAFFIASGHAVVCENVEIKKVISGHALMVECQMGGVTCMMPVRLRYIKAPEAGNCDDEKAIADARAMLEKWAKKSLRFVIWSPEDEWTYDEHGRLQAVVYDALYFNDERKGGAIPSLQDNVVTAGYAILIKDHGELPTEFGLHDSITSSEYIARLKKWGLWKNQPAWFEKKESPSK